MKGDQKRRSRPNVRSELLFLLAINGVLIGNVKPAVIFALVLFSGLLLCLFCRISTAAKYVLTYCLMFSAEHLLMLLPGISLFHFIIVISSVLRKFIPCFMVGCLILETTTPGNFLASMQRLHMPKVFSLPFAVVLRFFPTVKEDWHSIRSAMKLRGIGLSFGNVIAHPLRTVEYIIVPLLSSSIKIGDELSAAAIARGLGMERDRTSVYDVRFCIWDHLLMLAAAVFFVLITFV
ncbi:MAG: energy-coupling factor transporter transmembrane protein EcfT [Ruminococcus sp.]|nr:energy-coupling factor transporter transmembrane protein EcfT [Ruminococcus sp.]